MKVCFVSCGNDSCALIQWMKDHGQKNVVAVYSETGWAAPWWEDRVKLFASKCQQYGYDFVRIQSEGMVNLIKRKKCWPWNRDKFCTTHLKIEPAQRWLHENDPYGQFTCCVGVRRDESKERTNWPLYAQCSEPHLDRPLFSPLVDYDIGERNKLCEKFGLEIYEGRSRECYPCINAKKEDLSILSEERICEIEQLEKEMGFTGYGKPKTMFRPHRMMGATGIREAVKWGKSKRGQYRTDKQ